MITIVVPGPVTGKGRPRFAGAGRVYTPAKTANYETLLRWYMTEQMGDAEPLQGALNVRIAIYRRMPKSWSRAKRRRLGMKMAVGRPDIDNVAKIVGDAGNGVLWRDDAQIAELTIRRLWAEEDSLVLNVIEEGEVW